MTTATGVKYESRSVKTVRGMEARTRTKLEQEGWEFVSQTQGPLRSELTFRRPKPATPWKLISIGGGVVGILIIVALLMSALGGGDNSISPAEALPSPTTSQVIPTTSQVTPTEANTPSVRSLDDGGLW
jgi:hypothetical protein